jgi:two-component system OmpR family sensor kinase
LVEPLAVESNLRISTQLAPVEVVGDADRISQVLVNLLSNAIRYNRSGGEVQIMTEAGNNIALLRVRDTGQGIAPENLPHVFKRFFRADKSRSRAEGRNGLGLSICKAIVEAHGGTIDIASKLDEGTTVTIAFPLNRK